MTPCTQDEPCLDTDHERISHSSILPDSVLGYCSQCQKVYYGKTLASAPNTLGLCVSIGSKDFYAPELLYQIRGHD